MKLTMGTFDQEQIKGMIEARFLNGQSIEFDQNLLLSGLLDSLAVVSLVTLLERESGQRIPAQDVTLENFQTVEAISQYMAARG